MSRILFSSINDIKKIICIFLVVVLNITVVNSMQHILNIIQLIVVAPKYLMQLLTKYIKK